jgi:Flp pilus assembly protein TadB
MRKNWKSFFKQFYKYGIGDRKSGNIWKIKRNFLFVVGFWCYIGMLIFSLFLSFKIFVGLLLLSLLYLFTEGIKLAMRSKRILGIFYGFLLTLIKRIVYVLGVCFGK